MKQLISIRLDTRVLSWYKDKRPKGYRRLIQEVLEEHMQNEMAGQQRRLGRAQEIFQRYHARCFWHLDRKLNITSKNLHLVIDGLRKYGGREGMSLAEELCH